MQAFDNANVELITLGKTTNLVMDVVEKVRQAVVATMGPNGKYAVITTGTKPKVTKDGVTVAKALKFNDPRCELVNKVATEAPIKTDEECGDGTTTTTLLMAEMFNIYREFSTYQQQAFIDKLVTMWIEELERASIYIDVTDPRLGALARTSANNDTKLSELVVDLYRAKPGVFPSVELILGVESEDKVIHTNGLTVNMVYSNHLYAKGNRASVIYNNYIPIILDDYLRGTDTNGLIDLLGHIDQTIRAFGKDAFEAGEITVILICRSIETTMDNAIISYNRALQQQFKGAAHIQFVGCRMNGAGGSVGSLILQDLAVMMETGMYASLDQIKTAKLEVRTAPLTISSNKSILIPSESAKIAIEERVADIRESLSNYDARNRFTRRARFDENRVRDLTGEVVTVWVGGETESDVKERRDRFEDVVKAVKSALINGIVPGVGVTLINTMQLVSIRISNEVAEAGGAGYPKEWQTILGGVVEVSHKQNEILMEGVFEDENEQRDVLDLATGERGQPEDLGIYDTAYASITALKGGAQTAKILANMSSILISHKLDAVSLDG